MKGAKYVAYTINGSVVNEKNIKKSQEICDKCKKKVRKFVVIVKKIPEICYKSQKKVKFRINVKKVRKFGINIIKSQEICEYIKKSSEICDKFHAN